MSLKNLEIERKFLLKNDLWRGLAKGEIYKQGYLCCDKERTLRVRIQGNNAFLTIKGLAINASCPEFEYNIPLPEAKSLLTTLCIKPVIEKTRYRIPVDNLIWEVDEFTAENEGLIIAEVELERPDQPVELPCWIGREVTGEKRFYNASLVHHPYSKWSEEEKK